jgi:anaerobic selenocysteine-containing dehydrogenase
MVVCVDLFMNETARRFADVVLPGTAWLEELGFKITNTHLYLMERALEPTRLPPAPSRPRFRAHTLRGSS